MVSVFTAKNNPEQKLRMDFLHKDIFGIRLERDELYDLRRQSPRNSSQLARSSKLDLLPETEVPNWYKPGNSPTLNDWTKPSVWLRAEQEKKKKFGQIPNREFRTNLRSSALCTDWGAIPTLFYNIVPVRPNSQPSFLLETCSSPALGIFQTCRPLCSLSVSARNPALN